MVSIKGKKKQKNYSINKYVTVYLQYRLIKNIILGQVLHYHVDIFVLFLWVHVRRVKTKKSEIRIHSQLVLYLPSNP